MVLLNLALAPTLICLIYIFIRDKYEKEPLQLLFIGVFFGIIITAPISKTENFIMLFMPDLNLIEENLYISFVVAGFTEEFFKYVILFFLTWYNKNLNEWFDGIVYAVFISLGFAGVENILYVLSDTYGGVKTAINRGIFSVPGHALFGVNMGYYFTLAKFIPRKRLKYLSFAFFSPLLLHGIYDSILAFYKSYTIVIFMFFIVYLWKNGFKKIKSHVESSPFKFH